MQRKESQVTQIALSLDHCQWYFTDGAHRNEMSAFCKNCCSVTVHWMLTHTISLTISPVTINTKQITKSVHLQTYPHWCNFHCAISCFFSIYNKVYASRENFCVMTLIAAQKVSCHELNSKVMLTELISSLFSIIAIKFSGLYLKGFKLFTLMTISTFMRKL